MNEFRKYRFVETKPVNVAYAGYWLWRECNWDILSALKNLGPKNREWLCGCPGLNSIFGDWYNSKTNVIYLKSPGQYKRTLPILFHSDIDQSMERDFEFRPLFQEAALFSDVRDNVALPRDEASPQIIAFYSFKGGVGRTLHLIAALKALLSRDEMANHKILVVDGDLEAPGLTWWAMDKKELPEFSYLDLLALAQYDPSQEYKEVLDLAVQALSEAPLTVDKYRCYFLPAFRSEDQLMRFPVRPEHLIRRNNFQWENTELLLDLGKILGVKYILVDLRAGLSELSAPLLFDARVLRFLITTYSQQSVYGTSLVLNQLAKMAPDRETNLFDPIVIFSMLPEELKDSPEILETQSDLLSSYYPDLEEDDTETSRLTIATTYFAHELLYLEGLEQTWNKLSGKSLLKQVNELLEFFLINRPVQNRGNKTEISQSLISLETVCMKLENAESGAGIGYLPIPAIRNLGQRFVGKIPMAVVMGAKGAGKTYLYLQLVRLQEWDKFLKEIKVTQAPDMTIPVRTLIFPFLESRSLEDSALQRVIGCRENVWESLQKPLNWSQTLIRDDIRKHLKEEQNWTQSDWRKYWIHMIGKSLGVPETLPELISLDKIEQYLKVRNIKVIVLVDGLEDLFDRVKTEAAQQEALSGLLEVPENLRELRESYLGIICFVRRDFVRAVINQNIGQFEARYSAFDLTWDFREALRLAVWIGIQAKVLQSKNKADLLTLRAEELAEHLVPFWGRKLGTPQSKEAITSNWVLAALSDFNGQLQARDLVRLIRYAARDSVKSITYFDRLLQPMSVRRAIEPCSSRKIEEFKDEVANIAGIFAKLQTGTEDERRVPFSADKFALTTQEIELLEVLGVLKKEKEKYYIPEIFRYGLGFSLERGARPMVLAWKRKLLSGL